MKIERNFKPSFVYLALGLIGVVALVAVLWAAVFRVENLQNVFPRPKASFDSAVTCIQGCDREQTGCLRDCGTASCNNSCKTIRDSCVNSCVNNNTGPQCYIPINNQCVLSTSRDDCRSGGYSVKQDCLNQLQKSTSGTPKSNKNGGNNNGGGGTSAAATTAAQVCNSSSPADVWSCYQKGINGVGKGNCAYCWAVKNGVVTPGAGSACYNDCFSKTGNGSGCTYVCNNSASCWSGCSSQGKTCLGTCLAGGGNGQTHLACGTVSGSGIVKINDNDPSITYSGPWGYVSGGGGTSILYKTDYHFAPAPLSSSTITQNVGAAMSFSFTGTAGGVGLVDGGNRGYADIYVDGVKVDSVNYHTTGAILGRPAWVSSTLDCGQHTIKVTQSDTDVANHGKGVVVDYVQYSPCGAEAGGSVCKRVAGAGSDECTPEGANCPVAGANGCSKDSDCTAGQICGAGGVCRARGEADVCWGSLDLKSGRCVDCNGDGTVNILDFSCFRRGWLQPVSVL